MTVKTKPTIETSIYIPDKAQDVLLKKSRYKVLYGGRGSGKSVAFAEQAIVHSLSDKIRILCTREMQNSIKDSVHKLLCDRIDALGLTDFFNITRETIKTVNGSEFIFKGLRHNISEIKSTEGIDICWVEEAEKVINASWDILIPTIRKENSEIWVSFNPEDEKSATYQKFVVHTPPESAIALLNYWDNRMFPDVLRREMEYCKRVDYEKYQHVWEGQVKRYGDVLIFSKKIIVEPFETPENVELYFGADWGFSVDPTVLGRMFILDNTLYIDYEFYGVGVEINELEAAFDTVPESRDWLIVADSERPDTISHMVNRGFNIAGAKKGKGSVADGIEFLRGFDKIVIHPRCKGAVDNFTNYKWKQDRITQEILPIPADGSDHWPDSARYALERFVKTKDIDIRWI